MKRAALLVAAVVAAVVGLVASPAGAQADVPFEVVSGSGSVVIGTFFDPAVVTVVPGSGNAFILAAGDAPAYDNATTEERAAFCSVITRTVISGSAYLAGCAGDPIPAAEGQPVGFSCVGPGTCQVEFASTDTSVSLIAVDVPSEFGGTSYSGTVTPGEPPETTTTSTTTTEAPSSTTTTAPPPPSSWADGTEGDYRVGVIIGLLLLVFAAFFRIGSSA